MNVAALCLLAALPVTPLPPRVLLDCYYNNEWTKDAAGRPVRYHYVWSDTANSGFSILGTIVRNEGGSIDTLATPPAKESLRDASIYIIVDPDTPRETEHPRAVDPDAVKALADWVREGGVLLLLGNDSGNVDTDHLNALAGPFGIRFNRDSRNRVQGNRYDDGTFQTFPVHPLFRDVRRIFIKELATLRCEYPARPLLTDRGDVIIATARFGKGLVVAVGDPWFYNEYMDARRLPSGYDNARTAGNLLRWLLSRAGERADLIVDGAGGGDYRSIQEAVDSLAVPAAGTGIILIRDGVYEEKLFLKKSHMALVGERRDSTRIVWPELRELWSQGHGGSDWGSGSVNIDTTVTDLTIANLSVINDYGRRHGVWNKHQFAVRGAGTKITLLNAAVRSDGGDALSLWNRTLGMYYHADCLFEGWVDYVCPRGWCYITRSSFFGHNTPSASIWHDGSGDQRQKFVITNSTFDGVPGFPLGRNHLDAQVILVDCRFSERMADRPFVRPPSSPREWFWGDRHYFSGCHRDGGDYAWFRDNLDRMVPPVSASDITPSWTFDGLWDPESTMPSVLPVAYTISPRPGEQNLDPARVRLSWTPGRNALSHNVYCGTSSAPAFAGNTTDRALEPGKLRSATTYYWRVDEVTRTGIITGETRHFTTR